jgi:uncharacterized protein YkwD
MRIKRLISLISFTLGLLVVFLLLYFSPLNTKYKIPFVERFRKTILNPGPLISRIQDIVVKDTIIDKEVVEITNEYRIANGFDSLKENSVLNQAAAKRVNDMFRKQYFAHVSPDNKDISDTLKNVDFVYWISGENLALGYFKHSRDLVDAWMQSKGHRENILNQKYTQIGVAHKLGTYKGKKQIIAVQVFAKPLNECPQVSLSLKNTIDSTNAEIKTLSNRLTILSKEINQLKTEISGSQTKKEQKELYNDLNRKIKQYNYLVSEIRLKQTYLNTLIKTYNNQIQLHNNCAGN